MGEDVWPLEPRRWAARKREPSSRFPTGVVAVAPLWYTTGGGRHAINQPAPHLADLRRRPAHARLLYAHTRPAPGQADRQLRRARHLSSLLRRRDGHAGQPDHL